MKVSDLIDEARKALKEYGNVDVTIGVSGKNSLFIEDAEKTYIYQKNRKERSIPTFLIETL